jgi:hypothetical protein
MYDQWYLAREGQRHGPYDFESFRRFAAEGRLSPDDMVMNGADQRWVSARAVTGLSFPNQPPSRPVAAQVSEAVAKSWKSASPAAANDPETARQSEWNRLREIARWQRVVNLALLPYVLLYYFAMASGPIAVLLCNSLAAIGLAWVCAKQASALGLNPWLFGGLAFVPCVSGLELLFLMSRATKSLNRAGVRVGLFGAKLGESPPASFASAL